MPLIEKSPTINGSEPSENPSSIVHVFPSRGEFLKIKGSEVSADKGKILRLALRQDIIEMTEPCTSRLCPAPASAHRINARAA